MGLIVSSHIYYTRGTELTKSSAYNRINSTKSPASGSFKVSEPSLMLQVGGVVEFVCA